MRVACSEEGLRERRNRKLLIFKSLLVENRYFLKWSNLKKERYVKKI
jgi:hypothetical protein